MVTEEDEKITNYSPLANQNDSSGVNEDYAIGGWLFGCGVWSVEGLF